MADEDFDEQLRLEQIEKAKAEGDYGTYTDDDGTVFEWDAQKKAYFPKIDDDFIAKYQMSYGQSSDQAKEQEETAAEEAKAEEEKRKAYEQYCRDYYNYYYANQGNGEGGEGADNSGKGENSEDQAYSFEDYLAYCNYYYGPDHGTEQEAEDTKGDGDDKSEDEKKKADEKKKERPEGWFEHDSEKSTHIYISGLPLDITEEEYKELMTKYGLIMFDPFTRKPKLKLYKDENGQPKGDGLCCFIKQESVELTLKLLDGSELRGHKISVERAQFQMKGEYKAPKRRKKLSNKEKRKIKEKQQKLFDWRPEKEGERPKCEQTVILKNMFDPKEFEENPMEINELRVDVRTEAAKFGEVKRVTVYDRHIDGVISVKFKEAEEADMCISQLNGRWFAKRRIIAQVWDGKTKYEVEETEEQREARLKKWQNFLETGASAGPSSVPAVTSSDSVVTSSEGVVTSSEGVVTSSESVVMTPETVQSEITPSENMTQENVSSSKSVETSKPVEALSPSQSTDSSTALDTGVPDKAKEDSDIKE